MTTAKIIFSLGIVNLVTVILLLASCRWLPMARLGKNVMKNRYYKSFYKYHSYLWYVLGVSIVIHASLAIAFYGFPW